MDAAFNFKGARGKFVRARQKQQVNEKRIAQKYGKRKLGSTVQLGTGGSSSRDTARAVRDCMVEARSKIGDDREFDFIMVVTSMNHPHDDLKVQLDKVMGETIVCEGPCIDDSNE
jgi:hypothetical protein